MEHPVLVVGPDIRVVVREDMKPGDVFIVDAATLWTTDLNDPSGWKRPLMLKGVGE
jgi:hypothetical protein